MLKDSHPNPTIAVLIPCYNEERTIGKVITDLRAALPSAGIYVFDNNCTDRTAEFARKAGAAVIREKRQGKGYVVTSMFDRIVADYYLMIDGDDTYPAEVSSRMIRMLMDEEADIVVANRLASYHKTRTRPFHSLGNKLVRWLINISYHAQIRDPMSGMRAFNYNAVAALPFLSSGFEIETEITVQALFRRLVIREIDIEYRDRPEGSYSKLNTFKDGITVLLTIFMLLKAYRPMTFFGLLGLLFIFSGLASGWVFVSQFLQSGLLKDVFPAMLSAALVVAGFVLGVTGVIIHTINYRILEASTILLKASLHLRRHLEKNFPDSGYL